MRYVVAVAETGGFTRAAERCHVVQSALSHQIARLEQELGARLFHRTSRSVRLTTAGEAFLPVARQALDAAGRARAEVEAVTAGLRGRLAVGAISTVACVDLPRALARFRAGRPQVRVVLRSGMSEELIEQVRQGLLDVAFIGLAPGMEPTGVAHRVLARGELVAVVPAGHRLAGRERVALAALAGETFVDFPAGSAARRQRELAFTAAGLTADVDFEVTSAHALAELVAAGLGVGMVPEAVTADLPHRSRLHVLRLEDAPHRVEHVVWNAFGAAPVAGAFLGEIGAGDGSGGRAPGAGRSGRRPAGG